MPAFLTVDIWKKGSNKQTSMPDYQIEINQAGAYTISRAIDALQEIADALKREE